MTAILPASCVYPAECDDAIGFDFGPLLMFAATLAVLVAAFLLLRRGRAGWAAVTGAAAVCAGVWVLLTASASASFGWFAYAPLGEAVFVGAPLALLGFGGLSALLLVAAGLLALGGAAGSRIARHQATRARAAA